MKFNGIISILILLLTGALAGQSISITYPTVNAEICRGGPLTITWTYSGHDNEPVRIGLLKGGNVIQQIARTASNGSFTWTTVPASLAEGSYKIGIRVVNTSVQDISDSFRIRACFSSTTDPVTVNPSMTPQPHSRPHALNQLPDLSLFDLQYDKYSGELRFLVKKMYTMYGLRADISIQCPELHIEKILRNMPMGVNVHFPLAWPEHYCQLSFDIFVDPDNDIPERNENNNRFQGILYRSTEPYSFISPQKITIVNKLNQRFTLEHSQQVELSTQSFDYDPMYNIVYMDVLFDVKPCSKETRKNLWVIKETDNMMVSRTEVKVLPLRNLASYPVQVRLAVKVQPSNYLTLWTTHDLRTAKHRDVTVYLKFR